MAKLARSPLLSVDEYLRLEAESNVKHEYVSGLMVAQAGTSKRHNQIVTNLVMVLAPAARGSDCQVYTADVKLRAASDLFYYPDVMVVCDPSDDDPLIATRPCLVVEVISPSTETTDRREKLMAYKRIETLQGYLLVAQDARRIEAYQRTAEGWEHVQVDDALVLPCLKVTLQLADIYEGIDI